jgi:hypothetical protein
LVVEEILKGIILFKDSELKFFPIIKEKKNMIFKFVQAKFAVEIFLKHIFKLCLKK